MAGEYIQLFCAWLTLTLLLLTGFKASARNTVQVYALERKGNQLCAVEIRNNFSVPICHHEAGHQQWLRHHKTLKQKVLGTCPESWLERDACVIVPVRDKPLRPNPFKTLYHDLIVHPINQVFFFVQHSVDDFLEDIFALGAPAAAGAVAYWAGMTSGYIAFVVFVVHTLSSPLGDSAGDWVQKYQSHSDNEKEIEWLLSEIIANKIEDAIKAVYICACYSNTLTIKLLEKYYFSPPAPEAASPGSTGIYNSFLAILLTYDTYMLFERYNWINEIADAIADMFTELFH